LRTSWAKVLHQDLSEFSNEDVFFEVGGDSITALQLVDAAFEQGIVLTVEQIFVNASLEDMALAARVIETEHGSPRQTPSIEPFSLLSVDLGGLKRHIEEIAIACCVKSGQVETAYPCTPMQEALVAVTDTTENAYVMQITCEIRPEVPIEQFRQAWLSTVRANPVLRSRICHLDGVGYVQAVIDDAIGWNNTEDDLNSFLQNDARSPIKSGDPFFRFTVVSDAQSRHFVWTLHHALCDGASVTEVFDEVSRRFTNQSVLKRPSYEQFIASISPDTTKQRNYWQQTFNQCGFNYASYPQLSRQGFEAKPSRSIRRVLELNRTTPFDATKAQLLRAAWAVLQSHYTGNEDVVFGEIMNGRASLQTFGMSSVTGPTICLVPIGLRIDPNLTVSSLLLRVREQAAELLSFEQTGIAKIRKYLAEISLSASTACDFQTLFVVHSSDFSDLTAPALQRIGLRLISGLGKSEQHPYPLVISILISTGDAVILNLEYDERVISIQHANNLIHQFQAVLTQLSEAKEETLLSSIVPFSATDLLQIKEWNQHTPKAVEKCIHQLFEEQVHRSPTAEALVSVSETLTYAEVHNISTSVALQLVNLGVGPEEFVAICFEKSVWAVIAMLAIWKAGGAYVPIDPTHPQGRKKEIANRAKVKLVLVSRSNATDFDGICEHILTLDDAPISFIRQGCGQLPSQTLLPTSSAYLLFTSGTTGKPKGVVISHSALCTGMVYQAESFGLNSKTRMLQFASYTFDASVQEIFATLVVGGTVCVPSDSDRLNNLAGIITALQVDTVVLTPTVVNLLSPELIPFVKKINMGGEPVTSDIITKWAHHVRLTNGYGPSETTVCCAMNVGLTMDTHPANIGRAIGSTMWLVQPDNHDKLSAIGCVGEIVVSGALLASGYYGDKVTTDASFIYEPDWLMDFINTESAFRTIYKTGDLARYNADGTFQYVGRKDTQVKLRGFRIELGEIEARVMEHGSSNAAVVLLPKEGNCANQIVAIVSFMQPVLTESSKLGIHVLNKSHYTRDIHQKLDSIKKHLQYTLPEYMVPSLWVVLENMPLLVSGKVDRKAIKTWVDQMDEKTHQNLIRDLYDAEEELKGSFLPGSRAYTLREIWSIVLNVAVDRIGINTSFYSLGGDSITAIQVVSKAKSRGLHLAVRDILTRKTLGAVLPVILENTNDIHKDILHQPPDGQFDLSPIQKLFVASNYGEDSTTFQVEAVYPCSPMQREILLQQRMDPSVFLVSWEIELRDISAQQKLHVDMVINSWKKIVFRHPILRSRFLEASSEGRDYQQVVLRGIEPDIIIDKDIQDFKTNKDWPDAVSLHQCRFPHRARFLQHGNAVIGYIEANHAILDGWSVGLLQEELLETIYDTEDSARSVKDDQAPPYQSFISTHSYDRVSQDVDYWRTVLSNQKPSILAFPLDFGPKDVDGEDLARTIVRLPRIGTDSLNTFAANHDLTFASIFEAAWAQTLSIYTRSSQVAFGYIVSGRDQDGVPHAPRIIGPLINILPYHLRNVSTERSPKVLADLATRIQEQRVQDGSHSFCRIQDVLEQYFGTHRLFNTAVNFQRRASSLEKGHLAIRDLERLKDPWSFDVLIRIIHIDTSIQVQVEFNAQQMNSDAMKKVVETFKDGLQLAIAQ
ncbi:non-ribosomal peptide synthetase module, partial [Truncatella angustata]